MKSDKELYRQLRGLSLEQLWTEAVPRFDRAPPRERQQQVALIRTVGVAFAAAGTTEQREAVRAWLRQLLQDPSEKIRRYAMAALPKVGAGASEEGEILSLLKPSTGEREKKFVGRALEKIGGAATLAAAAKIPGLAPQTEQKIKASLARQESPSAVRLDRVIENFRGLRLHLRCRRGLETIVRQEVQEFIAKNRKFKLLEFRGECVALTPKAPFSLTELYQLRCFDTVGFGLGVVRAPKPEAAVGPLAEMIAQPLTKYLMQTLTEGSLRYRLEYVGKGHQRGAVREVASRAFKLCPEILNDARQAAWSVDLYSIKGGTSVELRPKLTPDPRLYYRTDDVWASSHPPLAACMARLSGRMENEVVWDPFCGSGMELIERALLGGVKSIHGTDLDAQALAIAQANVAAAKLPGIEAHFTQADFRDFAKIKGIGRRGVTLIITNPPMGRRIRVPSLHGLIEEFFVVAAAALQDGGRLVFPNPLRIEPRDATFKLEYRQPIDLGGFECRLEIYRKHG